MAVDIRAVDPLEYLRPFLAVVTAPHVSGPITRQALGAVRRLLEEDCLGTEGKQCAVGAGLIRLLFTIPTQRG